MALSRGRRRQLSRIWQSLIADPAFAVDAAILSITARLRARQGGPVFIVGTHHKVLTLYFLGVFNAFAVITGRRLAHGQPPDIDTTADIIILTHSDLPPDEIGRPWVGLHARRDPRDMIVSAMNYHMTSKEPWLHEPVTGFDGLTYQEKINSLPDVESRLLLEFDNLVMAPSRENIEKMLAWDYDRAECGEVRFEDVVAPGGAAICAAAVAHWPLGSRERRVLEGLFRFFHLEGPGVRNRRNRAHIRNPTAGKWRAVFSERVARRFDACFGPELWRIGYERSTDVLPNRGGK